MKQQVLVAVVFLSSSCRGFLIETQRGQRKSPLRSSFLNEPLGGVPVVQKTKKIISPDTAVGAEGGDVLSKEVSESTTAASVRESQTKAPQSRAPRGFTTREARSSTDGTSERVYSTARATAAYSATSTSKASTNTQTPSSTNTQRKASTTPQTGHSWINEPIGCYVSEARTFVTGTDAAAAEAADRVFVAGGGIAEDSVDEAAAQASKEASRFANSVLRQAFTGVGEALQGMGGALLSDTQSTRDTLTSWMLLYPAWLVFGGSTALVGELIVAAILPLIIRNAAKIQEAVLNEEVAANRYDHDGWWGEFVPKKETTRSRGFVNEDEIEEFATDFETDLDEAARRKSREAKKITYVKVLKESLVSDILGKRSFVYDLPVEDSWTDYVGQEDPPNAIVELETKDSTEASVTAVPLEEQTVNVETSSDQFRTNHMLDFSYVPPEALEDPFVLDILEKRNGASSRC